MRIKEDRTSWRSNGIIKRDYKHDPSQPQDVVTAHSKKDTKKWCKGKVGRPHVYKYTVPQAGMFARGYGSTVKMPICRNCGKQDYRGLLYLNNKTGTYQNTINWDS